MVVQVDSFPILLFQPGFTLWIWKTAIFNGHCNGPNWKGEKVIYKIWTL